MSDEAKAEVLGVDYVMLKGSGGRDRYNGATVKGDTFMHLGIVGAETATACKKGIENFLLTHADVKITCPSCIKVLKRDSQ
jgi:hypothetical protein